MIAPALLDERYLDSQFKVLSRGLTVPRDEPVLYRLMARAKRAAVRRPNADAADLLWACAMLRQGLVRRYSYAVPCNSALDRIVRWSPLVEVGAGTGYWAKLLKDRGADIVAYDHAIRGMSRLPPEGLYCDVQHPHTVVLRGSATSVKHHPDRTLLLCWPPMSNMARDTLDAYTGSRLIYIGEGRGGCTANDAFFSLLDASWTLVDREYIPQWPFAHDEVFCYERTDHV